MEDAEKPLPPLWYDDAIDYTDPRYQEALAFGRAAAKNARWGWEEAESSLMEVWSLSPRQGKWTDVRGAVFHGWEEARLPLSLDDGDGWADSVEF